MKEHSNSTRGLGKQPPAVRPEFVSGKAFLSEQNIENNNTIYHGGTGEGTVLGSPPGCAT